ncbi:MAG: hypothetical protein U5K51_08915 [Flavobacteriaceae bacterium]|nr:hypothetical protein [Flavobacteriaceae bacterium]
MRNTRSVGLALVISFAMIYSCKKEDATQVKEGNAVEETIEKTSETAPEITAGKGKYSIKSGIVEYKTRMMGMEVKQVHTFDDYGKLEAQDVAMEMMGTKIHNKTIIKDGYLYNLDLIKKTGTKSPINAMTKTDIDFENLSEELIKDMDLKKLGTEVFLGKTCEKMSIDYKKMQMKGTYLVYKGVPLSMDNEIGTMKIKMVADKFVENPSIPADKFEIPADIVLANQ